jgi:hypothetical protein
MIRDQDLEHLVRDELKGIVSDIIWRNTAGDYEVFGNYKIVPKKPVYEVWIHATHAGTFNSTKTALSWCIADKYHDYRLARDLLNIDNSLANLSNDIFTRIAVANRTKKIQLREDIETKIEPKIIRKKQLENQLAKCVNSAKYLQQRGFNNETARTSRVTKNTTSR